MTEPDLRMWETNGIKLRVAEAGTGPPVVLLHGWPESGYSWRHQIPALADAGYRVIAPDQRGYGRSDAPDAVEDYDIHHLCDDVVGLLDQIDAEDAVIVGHDWGAIIAWQFALLYPDRTRAVCGMSVPFAGRMPVAPTQAFKAMRGEDFFYILYFQELGVAEAEFDADPRGFLSRVYGRLPASEVGLLWGGPQREPGWLQDFVPAEPLPDWLSQEELDYYVGEFERAGFRGGINYYRNFDRNWETTPELAEAKVTQPALFVAGEKDPVIAGFDAQAQARMHEVVPSLSELVLIPGAAHWVQQEKAAEVNAALLNWLGRLDA